MSVLPFQPSDQIGDHLVFATTDHQVMTIDESVVTTPDGTFIADWISQSLNREDAAHEYTIRLLKLWYTAQDDTTISVSVSGDGGETWNETRVVEILATTGSRTRAVNIPFGTTGFDLRFRIRFDTDVLVNVWKYRPRLIKRGPVEYARGTVSSPL